MAKPIVNIKFLADLSQFSDQLSNAVRKMNRVGKEMERVGKNLTLKVTAPLTALGAASVFAFDRQAKAIAQVESGLKSTQNQVGITSEELQRFASELQKNTLFGDEDILQNATAQLLTFTNITGEQFKRTQTAALDLATRLDSDLKSASIQLGKALNDPVANLSALSRAGIQFSKEQKVLIKSLAETGRLAEAQTVILDELEKQYGGSAEAAAKAGAGGITQLKNDLSDLFETFGEIIFESIKPFIQSIRDAVQSLKNLSPETKKTIVVIAGLAAAVGPLLVSLGFLQTTVIPLLIKGFIALSSTTALLTVGITAAVAGIVAIGKELSRSKDRVDEAALAEEALTKARKRGAEKVSEQILNIKELSKKVADETLSEVERKKALDELIKISPEFQKTLVDGKINLDNLKTATDNVTEALLNMASVQAAQELIRDLNKELIELEATKSAADVSFLDFLGISLTSLTKENALLNLGTRAIENQADAVDSVKAKIEALKGFIEKNKDLFKDIVITPQVGKPSALPQVVGGRAKTKGIDGFDFKPVPVEIDFVSALERQVPKIVEQTKIIRQSFLDISQAALIVGDSITEGIDAFAEALVNGGDPIKAFVSTVLTAIGDLIIQMGKALIQAALIAKAFKNIFLNPFAGLAIGIAATIIGNLIKKFGAGEQGVTPRLASGGLAFGETLAVVGDNANARRDPEVIAPLSKLQSLLQPNNIVLSGDFRLNGQDLVLALDRVKSRNNRIG